MPYLAHFGLEEHPFALTPDVDYFFPTQEYADIVASLDFALRRDTGIIKVVGEVGTGKTLLCRLLVRKLVDSEAVAYINAPRANANSILLAICQEFGITIEHGPDSAYSALNRFLVDEHAKGRLAVVVVDEAQHLGREGLELVRLISNLETEKRKLLQIVLFGQTELDELLRDHSLRQLNQRIAFSLSTKPLSAADSKAYVEHRVRVSRRAGVGYEVFAARAVDLLARSCGGVPRVINIVADKSLLAAFADGSPVVQSRHVAEALEESDEIVAAAIPRHAPLPRMIRRAALYLVAGFALAALAAGILAALPEGNVISPIRAFVYAAANVAVVRRDRPETPAPSGLGSGPLPPSSLEPREAALAPADEPRPVSSPAPAPDSTSEPVPVSSPGPVSVSAPEPAPVSAPMSQPPQGQTEAPQATDAASLMQSQPAQASAPPPTKPMEEVGDVPRADQATGLAATPTDWLPFEIQPFPAQSKVAPVTTKPKRRPKPHVVGDAADRASGAARVVVAPKDGNGGPAAAGQPTSANPTGAPTNAAIGATSATGATTNSAGPAAPAVAGVSEADSATANRDRAAH